MAQRHFFATADDLLVVLERVEGKLALAYTLSGLFESPDPITIQGGASLPSLRLPAESSSSKCPTYLVTPSELSVNVRPVPQRLGGIHYAVDQLANQSSIALTHGGLFAPDILISGRVATASDAAMAKTIQSAFSNEIGRLFTRIGAFYVGPMAVELLARGCRLTHGVQSPPAYDLQRAPNNSFKPNPLRGPA